MQPKFWNQEAQDKHFIVGGTGASLDLQQDWKTPYVDSNPNDPLCTPPAVEDKTEFAC
jgi:hypothetical protein